MRENNFLDDIIVYALIIKGDYDQVKEFKQVIANYLDTTSDIEPIYQRLSLEPLYITSINPLTRG